MKNKILVIDDDTVFIDKMKISFRSYEFDSAGDRSQAVDKCKNNVYDLIMLDLKLNPYSEELDGLGLIGPLKSMNSFIPLIVVTADEKIDTVITAMKLGADDFLRKSSYDLLSWQKKFDLLIENRTLSRRLAEVETESYPFIGNSLQVLQIKRILESLANDSNITVLITGETGVGKEVAARYLHKSGARKKKPFIAVNLSVFQDSLIESSLFGHKKGAFTGANYDRQGYFLKANGGVLFLDEIGNIPESIQVKLLRFLETKIINKLGDEKEIKLDVQIIAATNQDLKILCSAGKFREDLYYRLKNFEVSIPPLRSRKDDIIDLLRYYFKSSGYENLEAISENHLLNYLKEYSWPGNIRELRNTVDTILLRSKVLSKKILDKDCLPQDIIILKSSINQIDINTTPDEEIPYNEKIILIDLQAIDNALKKTYGKKSEAANTLNMNSDRLRYKILKYSREYPELINQFSSIKKYYKNFVN